MTTSTFNKILILLCIVFASLFLFSYLRTDEKISEIEKRHAEEEAAYEKAITQLRYELTVLQAKEVNLVADKILLEKKLDSIKQKKDEVPTPTYDPVPTSSMLDTIRYYIK